MHINEIRLSMARTPGNYLQKYKGSLCSGNSGSNGQRPSTNMMSSKLSDLSSLRERRNIFNRNSNTQTMNDSGSIFNPRGKAVSAF